MQWRVQHTPPKLGLQDTGPDHALHQGWALSRLTAMGKLSHHGRHAVSKPTSGRLARPHAGWSQMQMTYWRANKFWGSKLSTACANWRLWWWCTPWQQAAKQEDTWLSVLCHGWPYHCPQLKVVRVDEEDGLLPHHWNGHLLLQDLVRTVELLAPLLDRVRAHLVPWHDCHQLEVPPPATLLAVVIHGPVGEG